MPVTPNVATSYVVVEDRNGNVQVHNFNSQGNPTTIEYRTNRGVRTLAGSDEPDYVVTNTYVEDGSMRVSRRTESGGFNVDSAGNLAAYSAGMTVDYEYDQHQRLVPEGQRRHDHPDAGTAGRAGRAGVPDYQVRV